MFKKRVLALLSSTILVAGLAVGCGSNSGSSSSTDETTNESTSGSTSSSNTTTESAVKKGKLYTIKNTVDHESQTGKDMARKYLNSTSKVEENISILDAIITAGMAPSKGQARTLISQGGITLNDEKISDVNYVISDDDFKDGYAILRKGKKVYHKLIK